MLGSCAARLVAAPDWFGVAAPTCARRSRAVADAHDYRAARHRRRRARAPTSPAGADRFVRDRFVVTGDPRTVADRFAAFGALGVDGVVLAGALDGVLDRLDDLGHARPTQD